MGSIFVNLIYILHLCFIVYGQTIPAALLQSAEAGQPDDDGLPHDDAIETPPSLEVPKQEGPAPAEEGPTTGPPGSTLVSTQKTVLMPTSQQPPAPTTTIASNIPPIFEEIPELETVDELFSEECNKPATLNEYCVLPEELKTFFGPDATMNDIGKYLLSDKILDSLNSTCPPGKWCLSSEAAESELEIKLAFWTNASDFSKLCIPDMQICLEYVSSDMYFDCDNYEELRLISTMTDLLCTMKEEPKASPQCIKQTLKTLHLSMADYRRPFTQLEDSGTDVCNSRSSLMGKNFLCTTAMCEKYSAVLYAFEPWLWFTKEIETLKLDCSVENLECMADADEEAMQNLLSSVLETQAKVYEKNWILEKFDMRAIVVISILSLAAMGALSLVIFVVWRKRKMRVRIRDGMEYLEIKPEETEAFLEGMDELGDSTKLVQ